MMASTECLSEILSHQKILSEADVIVHNNGAPTEEELRVLMENFKCNNLVGVYHSENLGYSAGAIESVDQALQGGWFDGYC